MAWESLAAAGTTLLGGLMQNAASAKQAQANREWQEGMSSTAHRREMADLQAAGLNPILTATGGVGASTPSGATASMGNPTAGVVASALEARRNKEEVQNLEKEGFRIDADAWLKRATKVREEEAAKQSIDQQRLIQQQNETEKHRTREASAVADIATSTAKGAKLEGEIDQTRYGEVMRYIDRAIRAITGGGSAYGNIKR